eukprot:295229-Pyramimonas_sp.AAC.1
MADDLNTLRVWLSWRVGVGAGGAGWSAMRSVSAAEVACCASCNSAFASSLASAFTPASTPAHAPASAFVYAPAFCVNAFAHISVHLPPAFALAFTSASLHPRLGLPSCIHACVCVH